jgi:hypothetical protein
VEIVGASSVAWIGKEAEEEEAGGDGSRWVEMSPDVKEGSDDVALEAACCSTSFGRFGAGRSVTKYEMCRMRAMIIS